MKKKIGSFIIYFIGLNFIFSIVGIAALISTGSFIVGTILTHAVVIIVYYLLRKKIDQTLLNINLAVVLLFLISFTLTMIISEGGLASSSMMVFNILPMFPYLPYYLLLSLMVNPGYALLLIFPLFVLEYFLTLAILHKEKMMKSGLIVTVLLALGASVNSYLFFHSDYFKYKDHGFTYMNGFSSTDFSDYYVYATQPKYATLTSPSSLVIEDEAKMPILDGAEACYPLYAAVANACYKDIAEIERNINQNSKEAALNGKIVQFTNSVTGFERLLFEENDIFFGAKPSKEQMEEAKEMNIELNITPIGKEGFVFFVEKDNPIDHLTSDQIKAIYHGDITNWAELGGNDEEIIAFQRPKNSGSQTMMTYFMGDLALKEPEGYEYFSSMSGVIKKVANYQNEQGAIGYSFRYFVEDLNQENDVKILAVDGIYPSLETIKDGSYPLTIPLCMVTRKDDSNENVEKMIDFMLSSQGQELVYKTGYATIH